MVARKAAKQTLSLLFRKPELFSVATVLAIVQVTALLFAIYIPQLYLPGVLVSYFGTPYLVAGYYAYVEEARRNGNPTLQRFKRLADSRYISLFIARVYFGIFHVGVLTSLLIGVSILGLGSVSVDVDDISATTLQTPPTELIAGATVLTLILLTVVLIPIFFMQFYDTALVLRQKPILQAFEESYTLVRNNIVSVCGYVGLRLLFIIVFSAPAGFLRLVATTGILTGNTQYSPLAGEPRSTFFGVLLLAVVVGTVSLAVRLTYHVNFYESLKEHKRPRERL